MKDKLIKQIVYINLFIAVLIYIPILVPFSAYIAAYGFMFRLTLIHLMLIAVIILGIKHIEIGAQSK